MTKPSFDTLRWTVLDSLTIAGRTYSRQAAQPGEILAFLVFPVIMTVLFGYVFGSAITLPNGGDYRDYLMPGIFMQVMAMTATAAATAVGEDMARGIIDRFRAQPIARSAVLVGRSVADLSMHLLSLAAMVLAGILLAGWRAHGSLGATAAAFGLLVLFGFAMIWVGTYIGLWVQSGAQADAATFGWLFPMTFLANTFVPIEGLPAWLKPVADWNPMSAVVAATRELFGNPTSVSSAWPLRHPVAASVLWSVAIIVVFVPLSVNRYRSTSR
ncbi:ABC transporter permease [Nonomuraea phyllanthi]|uniref:Transport permease protein n=1 Tax=Nonomuraea phyllanthi TaxID=2219224 RepID=A0A5C4W818_9ACTN|nr:ABC transporter permease [Nonomuraea phyllanthi]KAB8192204.1 ABC transporter permease [Nonomuraea phyllanthi]QFY11444.1 ABC transporter permease [Nonomuraea phyllanthi]